MKSIIAALVGLVLVALGISVADLLQGIAVVDVSDRPFITAVMGQ